MSLNRARVNSLQSAAEARAAGVRQRSHRPSQRRQSPEAAASQRVAFPAQIRLAETTGDADDTRLRFTGVASAYEAPYEMFDMFGPYTEVVSENAASESLARAELDVPLVLGHDQLRRIARTLNGTLRLSETGEGLNVEADLDPADIDVAYIAPKVRAGLIDEMSFAFVITKGSWSPDYTEFRIHSFDIHRGDVAIVGFGANPATTATIGTPDDDAEAERALLAARLAVRL